MKMLRKIKKHIAVLLISMLCISLMSGCGSRDEKKADEAENKIQTIVVDGYEVGEDEVMVYCLLLLLSGVITYNDVLPNEQFYKDNVIANIRETKILYNIAKEEGLEFNDNDIDVRNKLISSFKGYIPSDVFNKYGITDATIEKVFEETTYVQKFENDKRQEVGQKLYDKYIEYYKDYNFQNLYYIMFPAVEVDEENIPLKDEEGNYIPVSDEAKQEKKNEAEQAALAINSGEDAKQVAEDYEVDIYSSEQAGYVGAYPDELNEVLGTLEAGQCTDVYESQTGYYVIAVLTNHDEDLLEGYAYTLATNEMDSAYADLKAGWLEQTASPTDAALADTFWADFSLIDMAKCLIEYQIFQ